MMAENNDVVPITKGLSDGSDSSAPSLPLSSAGRLERSDSGASTSSQRSYSQRFSLATSQPYLVPDERLLQLKDRKLLMDISYDDLINVCWLLGIPPKSPSTVDTASYYVRSFVCCPANVLAHGFTLLTCFISDSCPGAISRFTHEHRTEELLAHMRAQVEKRKIIAPFVAAAVYHTMLTRRCSFHYAADTESLIMEKVEVVLQEGQEAGLDVDDMMRKMSDRLVDMHFHHAAPSSYYSSSPIASQRINRYEKKSPRAP